MSINLPDNVQLDTYESKYTPEQIEASIGKGTIIQNGTFWVWDVETMQYQDTGVYATPGPWSIVTEMLADGAVTWPKLAPEARKSNDNLLDNAYFIGGGSQQGGGQFPINQRGLTEYTAVGYTIDRWRVTRNAGKVKLLSDGLQIINETADLDVYFLQPMEDISQLDGRLVTLSVLSDTGLHTSSGVLNISDTNWQIISYLNATDRIFIAPTGGSTGQANPCVGMQIRAGSQLKLIAAKLELGPYQTLAYESVGGGVQTN